MFYCAWGLNFTIMQKRIIKILGFLLIFIALIGMIFIKISRKLKLTEEQKVITNLIEDNNSFNSVNSDIIGYLEIENLNIKKLIKRGTSAEILDQNIIGMLENSIIGTDNNDIVLAGHNINEVFRYLHQIKVNDIVKITTNDSCYRYKVKKIMTVDETDVKYLLNKHQNRLTLITCTNISNKRLLVVCDLVNF